MVGSQDITSIIRRQIEEFGFQVTMTGVGTVVEVGDGIARIHGLSGVKANELLTFPNGVSAMALNLEEESVGAIILAKVGRVIFGAYDRRCGMAGSVHDILRHPQLNHRPEVLGGMLADECGQLLKGFFRARRPNSGAAS